MPWNQEQMHRFVKRLTIYCIRCYQTIEQKLNLHHPAPLTPWFKVNNTVFTKFRRQTETIAQAATLESAKGC